MSDSFVTPWTVAHQAMSMGYSRKEYWNGLPFPSPGDFPDPEIEHSHMYYVVMNNYPYTFPWTVCPHTYTYIM